tara:strand:- start:51 stop:266 length:216 start_codon:yes stop_codon:yes gene_type:complete
MNAAAVLPKEQLRLQILQPPSNMRPMPLCLGNDDVCADPPLVIIGNTGMPALTLLVGGDNILEAGGGKSRL